MVSPHVPILLGVSAVIIFVYFFIQEKYMAENHPLLLDIAANYIVGIFFLIVVAALFREKD